MTVLGIKMIDDANKIKQLTSLIAENDGYCPCAVEQTEDTKCICSEFFETTDAGPCRCGLYIKQELEVDDKV